MPTGRVRRPAIPIISAVSAGSAGGIRVGRNRDFSGFRKKCGKLGKSKIFVYICLIEKVLTPRQGSGFFLFVNANESMKPKTRFYVYVAFLLLSVFCLGGSVVLCLFDGEMRNYLTVLILSCCAVTFLYLLRQMLNLNDKG